jgi:phospholipid transport system substrate-binding protein
MKFLTYRMIGIIGLIVVFCWIFPAGAALSPTGQLKEKVDQAMKILNDPALKGDKEKRRQMVTDIVDTMIDWQEVGKRTLAIHWKKRTPQEKEEFIDLFRDLLRRTYSEKLDLYSGESIIYGNETVEGNYATLNTKVVNSKKNEDYSVNYRLIQKGDRWLVYDIIIEGISAVNNYRIQFNEVIMDSSYEELIKRMKKQEFRAKEAAKTKK